MESSDQGKEFPFRKKTLMRSLERRLMFDAAAVAAITSPVFHFDAQDIDGDGDTGNQPSDGAQIATWNDPIGNDDKGTASGSAQPVYDADIFGPGRGGVVFDGADDVLGMTTTTELNNQTFYEKSFAVVFKTGDDVSGHQVIYEQGGGTKGYSISIADGHVYAYVWNKTNWSGADQHRSIDLGAVATDTTYRIIAIHDANVAGTWAANINGGAFSELTGVGFQGGHTGDPAIGGVVNQSLHPVTNGTAGAANFKGAVGELWSWNHALTAQEASDVDSYFSSKWFNSTPNLDTNAGLTLVEGSTLTIGSDKLDTSDLEQGASEIVYQLTAVTAHGDLKLNGVILGVSDTFTQQDVNEGRLSYANDGTSNPADSFSFTLYDGMDTTGVEIFNFTINPPPPSDPVITTLSSLNATEASSTVLTTAVLETTDLDTVNGSIIYEITSLSAHGDITNNGVALGIGDTFTQQNLIDGLVSYVNDGAGEVATDTFSFTVTDGSVTTAAETMSIQIALVEDESPIVNANNPLSISKGGNATITMAALQSTDLDTNDAALVYEITENSIHGTLKLNGVDLDVGDTFTQDDIDGGLVTYTHNGNASVADSFQFTVTDGVTTPAAATFSITVGPGAAVSGDTSIPNIVFHYDAQDINDDGGVTQPSDGAAIDSWNDTSSNGLDATKSGGQRPVYDADAFGGRGGIVFDGVDDTFDIADSGLINTGSYPEKSYAVVFETGSDVAGVQVIYEQGGGGNGYNIIIIDGTLYAYKWTGGESSSINLGSVEANTTYYVTAVHDATGATLADRTFSASLNGGPVQTINNVDVQAAHSGDVAIGGVMNDSQDPRDESTISGSDTALFKGAVGELLSWNQALTAQEMTDIGAYLFERWVNDPPSLDTNAGLNVYEGVTTVVDSSLLEAVDSDQSAAEIGYEVIALPEHGALKLSGVDLNVGDTFTQQDINDGKLSYAHDGSSDSSDSFKFTLTDGLSITALKTFEIDIDPVPPGEPVLSTLSALSATEDAATVLGLANIQTTDSDTANSDIIYEITVLTTHGDILNNGVALGIGDTFTQQDLIDSLISYLNDGAGEFNSDSFSFTVTDGTTTTAASTLPIVVGLVNDETPTEQTNAGVSLGTGVSATINSGLLSFTDLDSVDSNLVYEVTANVSEGTLYRNGVILNVGDTFTQDDINNNLISYVHDAGIAVSDGFSFTVTDGTNATATQNFDITIIPIDFTGDTGVANIVFHFDAQDVDNNAGTDNPADETALGSWVDTSSNGLDGTAAGGNRPVYDADAFGGLGGVRFDGVDDAFQLPDDALINTGSYTEKSVAVVFETGADLSGMQVIYEQGGSGTGYNIAIVDSNLYAYMWTGSSYFSLDLGPVETNSGYRVVFIHDATSGTATDRTFSASVNGGTFQSVNNVPTFGSHGGDPAIGGIMQDSQNPFNDADITGSNINVFNGSVGEIMSWNHALVTEEVAALDSYLARKWLPPHLTVNAGVTLNEGVSAFVTTTELNAIDLDMDDTNISFLIEATTSDGTLYNDGVTLSVGDTFYLQDVIDGHISYTHDGGEDASDSFTFTLGDGLSEVTGRVFTFTVNPVNDDPTAVTINSNTIDENSAIGTKVGDLSGVDVDSGAFTYSIIGNPEIFSIAGSELIVAASPDYEDVSSYSITVRVDDGAGGTFDQLLMISINNVNEAPTDVLLDLTGLNVPETSSIGTVVGHLSTIDPDGAGHTYSIVGDSGIFGISGDNIVLTGAADFESVSSYNITVRSDDGGFTFDRDFTINIGDEIEPGSGGFNPPPEPPSPSSSASGNNGGNTSSVNLDDTGFGRALRTVLDGFGLDDLFGDHDDQMVRKAVEETSLYARGILDEFVRYGGTVEANEAIEELLKIVIDGNGEDDDELGSRVYNYMEGVFGSEGLKGLTSEYQKLLDVLKEIDNTLHGGASPDLSSEMLKMQSQFDRNVEDFLDRL